MADATGQYWDENAMKIAFVGLGVMGYPMAGHLQTAGHQVTVFNRTAQRATDWVQQFGGKQAPTPAMAALGAGLVAVCVGNDDDVKAVMLGEDGVFAGLQAGAIVVDHTTASATVARELSAEASRLSLAFLDAPVSGGQAGAENGALTIMVGGEPAVFAQAQPVLDVYARYTRLLGPAGSGQLAKMVNQICIAGVVQGLAEGLMFAERAGLDSKAVIDVISRGAAQSWQMENRHETMLADNYQHGFAVDWMRKDLDIVLTEARKLGVDLPVTELIDGYYADVQAMGGGRWDTSSLLARLQNSQDQT